MQRQGFNMILLLPLHRPKQVYDFHKKMIPKMKQHIYSAVYPDTDIYMYMFTVKKLYTYESVYIKTVTAI